MTHKHGCCFFFLFCLFFCGSDTHNGRRCALRSESASAASGWSEKEDLPVAAKKGRKEKSEKLGCREEGGVEALPGTYTSEEEKCGYNAELIFFFFRFYGAHQRS